MKKLPLFFIGTLLCLAATAQKNGSIKGVLFDTAANQPVASATITLLQKKDSSLVSFTMTDNKGRFELTGLANGDYRLLVTHVNYHNIIKYFTISDAGKNKDLGNIAMTDKSKMLDEVTVTAEAPPVTLIGDTVQYNAGSFKVQPNGNVEQLLKKLPGVKVEKDGTVKAQGQDVKRVLVDGKEFFGTDPKVATRNLPADAVDKVQVYDKLSDQAQLTGFDDGNSEKTINLKLKQDKKKGLFGKVNAGGGTDGRYSGKFNVNSFKGARQFSVIGMGNNTNEEGFSPIDMLNFTGALNSIKGSGGTINLNISSGSPLLGFGGNNTGLRTIWGGGLNYNNIIGEKTDFTSNYFYNQYSPTSEANTHRHYFVPPDSSYDYNAQANNHNINNSHRLNLSADIQLDSFNSIKISPSFGYQQQNNEAYTDYQTLTPHQVQGSQGFSDNHNNTEGYNFQNTLLYRKKTRVKGRTFSFSLATSLNQTNGNGSITSINNFNDLVTGSRQRVDSIDQQNTTTGNLWSYNARAVYTEPIFKRTLLEFSLGNSYSHSSSNKTTFDLNRANGKFDQLNSHLSNNYDNTYGYTNAGIRLRMQQKKFSAAVGLNWQRAELEGKIISGTKDSVITKSFYNLLPNARFQYNFSKYKNLSLYYTAQTNQPTPSQLQPVPDNSVPLLVQEGNPDLKQEYSHAAQLRYMSVNPFLNRNFFAFFTLRETQNKIVSSDILKNGVDTSKPANANGIYDLSGDVSWGFPVRFLKSTLNLGLVIGYNNGLNFINNVPNKSKNLNLGPRIRLDMSPTSKLDLSLSTTITYNNTRFSLQSSQDSKYFTQEYETNVDWQLPSNFYFHTDFDYIINSQLANGFNAKVPLWNASISKQVLHFNRGEIKLTAFDLLNQNVGISHNSNANYIEDVRTVNLQRFFLLSFTYSLSKNGLGAKMNSGGIRMIRRG